MQQKRRADVGASCWIAGAYRIAANHPIATDTATGEVFASSGPVFGGNLRTHERATTDGRAFCRRPEAAGHPEGLDARGLELAKGGHRGGRVGGHQRGVEHRRRRGDGESRDATGVVSDVEAVDPERHA